MRKILISSLISLLLLNDSYAQTITMDGVGILTEKPANPGALGRTLGWGIKKIFTTPIKISGKVVGACLLSKKVCAGIAAGSLGFAYLYDHPEAVSHFLEMYPDKYDELQKYFDYRKSQTTDSDKIAKYDQAAEDMGLNARTIDEQLDLEDEIKNPDFQDIMIILGLAAQSIDQIVTQTRQRKNFQCSIAIAETLFLDSQTFNKSVNVVLPKKNDSLATLWNVDKYSNLQAKENVIERDHIPSYKAIEWFFKNNSNTTIDLSKQPIISTRNKRYRNLNNNLTAINIPEKTHHEGRTYGKKNEYIASRLDGIDSISLRLATFKDFATILWYEKFKKNNLNNYNNILNSFNIVYQRNKELCLYDL